MENKHKIEVFTAGCTVCQPTVDLVKSIACDTCEVTVYDLSNICESKQCVSKLEQYGIKSLPAVAVNGVVLDCCRNKGGSLDKLTKAGLGEPAIV